MSPRTPCRWALPRVVVGGDREELGQYAKVRAYLLEDRAQVVARVRIRERNKVVLRLTFSKKIKQKFLEIHNMDRSLRFTWKTVASRAIEWRYFGARMSIFSFLGIPKEGLQEHQNTIIR